MKEQYRPKTLQQKLGWLVEEMGEAQAAIGKTIRWGLGSVNPELPLDEQEMNGDWILRELRDVEESIREARRQLCVEMEAIDGEPRVADPEAKAKLDADGGGNG